MDWVGRVGQRVKLRDLHILLAVAKAGSMGKAAAVLAVSQPVVSKTIADMEHALGVRLLDRNRRGVEPTGYGRALLTCAVAVFDDLRRGVAALESLADPTAGELRFGCTEPLAAGFVGEVIERLAREYPRVNFNVVTGDPVALKERELRQRTVELAITPLAGLTPAPDLDAEVLFDDRQVVVVGADSKWARRRRVTLAALAREPWLLPPPDTIIGEQITQAFRSAGIEPPRPQIESFSVPLCHRLVAAGRFVTMLPVSMVMPGNHLLLKFLRLDSPVVPRPTGIITLRDRALSPLAELFIDRVRTLARPLAKLR